MTSYLFTGSIGINSIGSIMAPLTVDNYNAQYSDGLILGGTYTGYSSGIQKGLFCKPVFQPYTSGTSLTSIYNAPSFIVPSSGSVYAIYGEYIYNSVNSNLGTISDAYGIYVDIGSVSSGIVSNSYGLYVNQPAHGTNSTCAYFAGNSAFFGTPSFAGATGSIFVGNCVGTPPSTPSGGGLLYVVNGALTYKGSSGTITTLAVA